jgi:outer membrane protein assembly factor BamB
MRGFVVTALVACLSLSAFAQEEALAPGTYSSRDARLDALLEEAATASARGDFVAAVEAYLEVEAQVAKLRAADPQIHPVTEVGPGIDQGVRRYVRDRVAALPADALRAWRLSIDARAREALEPALASSSPAAVEAVLDRYPLSSVVSETLPLLAELAFEAGELDRAVRAWLRLEVAASPELARRASLFRFHAELARGDGPAALEALEVFRARGGEPDAAREPGGVSPRQLLTRLAERPGPRRGQAVDPAGLADTVALSAPELADELADELPLPPAHQGVVWVPGTRDVLVQDRKTVRRVSLAGAAGWTYSTTADPTEPGRLEVGHFQPALGAEVAYATLFRHQPAQVTPPAEEGEDWQVERQLDWRVVCLDLDTGALAWDAADAEAFAPWARDAEWLSAPLAHEGAVYVTALIRQQDLRAYLLRLDGATGALVHASFLVSRDEYDFLGLSAPPAPPVASPHGYLAVPTGLGAVAAVSPDQGEPVWLARYPTSPAGSQASLIGEGRRFRATPAQVDRERVVVAPVDGSDVLAFDALTGARLWAAPRGDARWCAQGPAGEVLLLGRRLRALDRASGRILFAGSDLGQEVLARPAVLDHGLIAVTGRGLLRVDLLSGRALSRLDFDDPRQELGEPLMVGEVLVTAGRARLNVYQSLAAERERIEGRYDGLWVDLMLGEMHARRGEDEAALERLSRAARPGGLDETTRLRAREAAFDVLAARAARAAAAEDDTDFLRAAASALGYAWDAAPGQRLARDPPGPAALRLAYRSAPLLRRYADRLAVGDGSAWWVRAVDGFQALLRVPPATLVPLGEGVKVDARAYARARLRELVETHGQDVYAHEDRQADEEFRLAQAADSTRALERVVDRFPASQRAADARWALAQSHERRGRRGEAARELERLVRDHPDDTRWAEAMARLVTTLEKLRRTSRARSVLEQLLAQAPEAEGLQVAGAEGARHQPLLRWAEPFAARLVEGRTPAARFQAEAVAELEPPLRRVHRSRTELEQEGPRHEPVRAPWLGPADAVLLRRGARLELRRVPGLELLLAVDDAPEVRGGTLRPTFAAEGLLVVPFPDRVEGWDVRSGARRWVFPVEDTPGALRVGDQPVHQVLASDDAVVILTGANELQVLDAGSGALRWATALRRRAGRGVEVQAGVVLALGATPGTIDAFDLARGEVSWSYPPRVDSRAPRRLSEPTWLDAATLAIVQDGKRIVLVDVTTGRERWAVTPEGAMILGLMPTADGRHLIARVHVDGSTGLVVYATTSGVELWRDEGAGPGGAAGRASIQFVQPTDDVVYTYRTVGGATELWSQDMVRGELRWRWRSPQGGGAPSSLIDTPGAVLVPRGDAFGQRISLTVLARGTGKATETHRLPGRRLIGQPAARDGTVVVTTDRGVFCLAHVDARAVAEAGVAVGRALVEEPARVDLRARLVELVESAGRYDDAVDLLRDGLLAEGVGLADYDPMFERLAAIAESEADDRARALKVRAMPRPPKIDGELDDWWRPWSAIELAGPRHVQPVQLPAGQEPGRWLGQEDLSADLYLGWDTTSFYFALDVRDTTLRPFDTDAERWIGDALLIGIDCLGNGGEIVLGDDVLLSLALTVPKRNQEEDEDDEEDADEADDSPQGSYFVRRKEDGSGVVYEAAIPWALFVEHQAVLPQGHPERGFGFGFNLVLTDDDGERAGGSGGPRGALKTLQVTPSILLHADKSRLWQGYVPGRFAKVELR